MGIRLTPTSNRSSPLAMRAAWHLPLVPYPATVALAGVCEREPESLSLLRAHPQRISSSSVAATTEHAPDWQSHPV